VLIVESLDRLSRQEIGDADQLICGILRKGISIVTLEPERELTPASVNDLLARIEMLVLASRANEESTTKSVRVRDAWHALHEQARKTGRAITPLCPGWLRLVGEKGKDKDKDTRQWEQIPEAVAIVRRIVREIMDGYSMGEITRRLNGEGKRTLRHGKEWDASTVRAIVRCPALIGTLQPTARNGGRRESAGEPITNYYGKGILTKKEWYRLQEMLDNRKVVRGRTGTGCRSLFKNMLHDIHGHALVITVKQENAYLVSTAARRGLYGAKYTSFRYDIFERYFLRFVSQLKAADLLPHTATDTTESDIERIEGELLDIDNRINTVRSRIATDPNFATLLDVLRDLESKKKELTESLESTRQHQHASTNKQVLTNVVSVADMLAAADDPTDLRLRLSGHIRQLVERIVCEPFTATLDGYKFQCICADVRFRSGAQRLFVIAAHRSGTEYYETWSSEEGIRVHGKDSLPARLGMLDAPSPRQPKRKAKPTR